MTGPFPYMVTTAQINQALTVLGFDPHLVHEITLDPDGVTAIMFGSQVSRCEPDMYTVKIPNEGAITVEQRRQEHRRAHP